MSEATEATATEESTAAQEASTEESQGQTEPQAGTGTEQGAKPEQSEASHEFTIPEGYEMTDADRTEMTDFFGKLEGIADQKQREQAMVDEHFRLLEKVKGHTEESRQAMHQEWASQAMSDKEFGGPNLTENLAGARKAMNSFSQPAVDANGKAVLHQDGPLKGQQMTEIEAFMNESGYGNHPAMIRVFHRINQALKEDHFVQGDMKPPERKKSAAETMYPNMPQ